MMVEESLPNIDASRAAEHSKFPLNVFSMIHVGLGLEHGRIVRPGFWLISLCIRRRTGGDIVGSAGLFPSCLLDESLARRRGTLW